MKHDAQNKEGRAWRESMAGSIEALVYGTVIYAVVALVRLFTVLPSESARPLTQDSEGGYGYRPKAKLGPRSSLDYDGRPNTTASCLLWK